MPLDAQGFSGRHDELRALHDMLPSARAAETDESVPVVIISGTAGVGKTALAIRFGHQVAKRFPDGQLYVNLRGRDPGLPPMEPIEALGLLLIAFGMPPHRLTSSTEERTALYRSLVDGKRILVVLDNASNAAQVRPLLPGSPDCLVVVTSRSQMAGLVAAEGATLISLDVLADDEAHEMLARRLGRERVAAEPQAADEIIKACAGLPLALSIAVGRATAGRAKRPLAQLAAELRDARNRLDALEEGDAATDVRAVLSLVLRPAQPGRRADVPPARPAPGPGRLPVGGGQPGRDLPGRGGHRAARAHPDPHGRRAPARPVHLP